MARLLEAASAATAARRITLFVDPEHLNVYLSVQFAGEPVPLEKREVDELLHRGKIVLPPEESAKIDAFVEEFARRPREIEAHRLASGIPPVPGKDAPIHWKVDVARRARHMDDDRTVNIYEVTRFINICRDDVILVLGDPEPGRDGTNVFGNPIPARQGRAQPIRPGVNAAFLDDQHTLVSRRDGAVQIRGEVVSVNPFLEVNGDVDFSVGNIDFNGAVHVRGSILDGFHVKTKHDLLVDGSIEAAQVECGGNLRVSGGIIAKGRGRLSVTGNLSARYVNGAILEVGEHLEVGRGIIESRSAVQGTVLVRRGGIIGGRAVVMRGLETAALGSKMSARTLVIVGRDPQLSQKLQQAEADLEACEEALRELKSDIDSSGETAASEAAHSGDVLRDSRMETLLARRDELRHRVETLSRPPESAERLRATIHGKIHSNVEVQIGFSSRRFVDEVSGPVRLQADEEQGVIKMFSL
ncbi:MAG: DUF342 domain-containing protein [Candidatus Eisenbacteria bacterium]|nr:DUF342 domain-containing protein [Candidatus Eisenbacteria bacterium]